MPVKEKETILIVDDTHSALQSLFQLLRLADYRVFGN